MIIYKYIYIYQFEKKNINNLFLIFIIIKLINKIIKYNLPILFLYSSTGGYVFNNQVLLVVAKKFKNNEKAINKPDIKGKCL